MSMNMVAIIQKTKDGQPLTREEIAYVVRGAADNSLPDYQLAAWLMAVCFRGMTPQETADLTMEMVHSGDVVDLSALDGVCVDKHSTGGVGDTTTLVLVPLVAACGVPVAKMSGRALGHTGGTLDKLESIPGMRIDLSIEEFIAQVKRIGCAVVGQTKALAPADKRLYALRDVTCTVDSMPMITASILSKKLAAGTEAIVLDVKTGNGALMRTLQDSIALAESMVRIGKLAGKTTLALVTGMDEPLGSHIGNALEVKEAIDVLAGRTAGPLLEVSLTLGSQMLVAGQRAQNLGEARAMLREALDSGKGLAKLAEMIAAQGGDARITEDLSRLPQAAHQVPVPALKAGFIDHMDTVAIGYAAHTVGAGRVTKDDPLDPAVGIVMQKRIGDAVMQGEAIAVLYVNDLHTVQQAIEQIQQAVVIGDQPVAPPPLIHAVVMPDGVQYLA